MPQGIPWHKRPDQDFVVQFTMKMNWLSITMLITAGTGAYGMLGPSDQNLIPLTSFDPTLMWIGIIGMGIIGSVWFLQGLFAATALRMTSHHISGFTLFGTKKVNWDDIASLQLKSHSTYGRELRINAKRSSPSGSIWLNCIPLYLNNVDRSLEEIVSAIQQYRPDLSL